MTDKAKAYADAFLNEETPMDLKNNLAGEFRDAIEAAYRAGYQAGMTDATRREFVAETQSHFERGMT